MDYPMHIETIIMDSSFLYFKGSPVKSFIKWCDLSLNIVFSLRTNGFVRIKFDTIKLYTISLDGPLYIFRGVQVIISKKKIILLTLKINFVLANSADLDEMPRYAAFHLDLHC